MVGFCWSRTELVQAFTTLLDDWQQAGPLEALVVTDTLAGKLELGRRGYAALTLAELVRHAHGAWHDRDEVRALLVREVGQHLTFVAAARAMGTTPQERDRWIAERVLQGFDELVAALNPDAVLVWNGWRLPQAALVRAAKSRQLPIVYLERGLVPDTLFIDRRGVNAASELARWQPNGDATETAAAREQARYTRRVLVESGRTIVPHGQAMQPAALRAQLGIPPKHRVVLLPLQIDSDSNLRAHSPLFAGMQSLLQAVEREVARLSNVSLLVKTHPEDPTPPPATAAASIVARDVALATLLHIADVVVTVNSTVGFEALLHGIPVVVAGRAVYGGKGFTHDVGRPDDLGPALRAALDAGGIADDPFEAFLARLLARHSWPLGADDPWDARCHWRAYLRDVTHSSTPRARTPAGKAVMRQATALVRVLGSRSAASRRLLILLGASGGYEREQLMRFVRDYTGRAELELLTRRSLRRCFFAAATGRYRGALALGVPRGLRRLAWELLPLRRKAVLD